MKSVLFLLFTTLVTLVSGFSILSKPSNLPTALHASRNRQKIASRSKWAEARGISDDGGVATLEKEDEDEASEDDGDDEGDAEEEEAAEEGDE